jgi:transposase
MREIVNALLYQSHTGCQWDYLPHDLPPVGAVKYYFYKWRDDGTGQTTIHDLRAGRSARAGDARPTRAWRAAFWALAACSAAAALTATAVVIGGFTEPAGGT